MAPRFGFRQIDRRDLATILIGQEIRSKNHINTQRCHQTSYRDLVEMRGTDAFNLPHGGVVNDYVAFYFSPLTGFTHTIHKGNVQVISPCGRNIGLSRKEDRVFLVVRVERLYEYDHLVCFSDYALNSQAPAPTVKSNHDELASHVKWQLFDEQPLTAAIKEIGYLGVCRYFFSRSVPPHQNRATSRMAELLVKGAVPLSLVECIVTPNQQVYQEVLVLAQQHNFQGVVVNNPGCFV